MALRPPSTCCWSEGFYMTKLIVRVRQLFLSHRFIYYVIDIISLEQNATGKIMPYYYVFWHNVVQYLTFSHQSS